MSATAAGDRHPALELVLVDTADSPTARAPQERDLFVVAVLVGDLELPDLQGRHGGLPFAGQQTPPDLFAGDRVFDKVG